jgi:hypothetical protein
VIYLFSHENQLNWGLKCLKINLKRAVKKRSSSGNSKKGFQRNTSDNEIPGLIPAMYGLAEVLPDEYQEPAKKVIGFFDLW